LRSRSAGIIIEAACMRLRMFKLSPPDCLVTLDLDFV
jgi:hypothetical protein